MCITCISKNKNGKKEKKTLENFFNNFVPYSDMFMCS